MLEEKLKKINKMILSDNLDDAETEYKKLLVEFPWNEGVKEWLWKLYIQMWKIEVAKDYFTDDESYESYLSDLKVKQENSKTLVDRMLEALNLLEAWKVKESENMYLELVSMFPWNEWIKEWLWKLYISIWDIKKAKEYISDTNILVFEEDEDILDAYELIKKLRTKGENSKIESIYLDLIEKYPDHVWIRDWYQKFLSQIQLKTIN